MRGHQINHTIRVKNSTVRKMSFKGKGPFKMCLKFCFTNENNDNQIFVPKIVYPREMVQS